MKSDFRLDINALRAFAVVSVMLYHFRIPGFNGGFIGVDVFFVISGFLMTKIIANGLEAGNFSLLGFYASRARRLLPALIGLCTGLLLLGFCLLPGDDLRELIRTLKGTLVFLSNFSFAEAGGYFDTPLQGNWLLHTWSLSVEWQFYLLYPILMTMLYQRFQAKGLLVVLTIAAAISFAASVQISNSNPVFAFYMLPTRAWEMLAGGLVFLLPLRLSRPAMRTSATIGLLALSGGVVTFSEQDLWPGYLALVPVLGTVLLLYGQASSRLFENRLILFTGTISYSVYLWHWPVVVLLYMCGLLNSPAHLAGGIVLSLVLGSLSFLTVETRTKRGQSPAQSLAKHAAAVASVIGVAAITASLVKHHPGLRFAYVEGPQPEYASTMYSQECFPNTYGASDCKLGTGEIKAILFGDSHAQSTAAAVQMENPQASLSWARGGCPPLMEFHTHDQEREQQCRDFMADKMNVLGTSYTDIPVVMFHRAGLYTDQSRSNSYRVSFSGDSLVTPLSFEKTYIAEYTRTVCTIAQTHPVYLVKPIPEMPFAIPKGMNLQQRIFQKPSDIIAPLQAYEERNRVALAAIDAAANQCAAVIVDPTPYLCSAGECFGSKNGVSLYFDDNHLLDFGNEHLRGLFSSIFGA
ncbi:acyltransferase family protein [Pseudomonas sp. HR96]|uniref:acyltransferase family protein n=1 Tax=Pseudomonas sp. HR96 TaxID=1027966 RepID=UPI002A762CBA|nr:acyltransferase family protein [Pseudomonas sp. HR96]WPP01467.1 acyltransferase family protein [Pseudomonas sp. HR96]